ncbi:MAG: hypothetical protein HGA22_03745 [Clostridiales bacterium]|nr:hypothetical protein [Clostridiales bacterium]
MDEFRKKYEYEEHKGVSGLILLFFCMLVMFEIALGLITMLAEYKTVDIPEAVRSLLKTAGAVYLVSTIFICVALFKIPRIAVSGVKKYLAARLLFLIPPVIYNFLNALHNPEMTPSKLGTRGVVQTTFQCLVLPMLYVLLFSFMWFIYFSRSKHVEETYSHAQKAFKENY